MLDKLFVLSLVLGIGRIGLAGPPSCAVENGDTNGDQARDLSDAVYSLNFQFLGGPAPVLFCEPAGDAAEGCAVENGDTNGDKARDLSDAVYSLNFQFVGGPAPVPICETTGVAVTSVDYPVIAHGGQLMVTGQNFTGATQVTIGGEVHDALTNVTSTSITIPIVSSATPVGAGQPVVVTAPAGVSDASVMVTVIHLMINEVDSDSPASDTFDFIELSVGLAAQVSLDGYVVVHFNGSNAGVIEVFDLAAGVMTDASGLFLIGPSLLSPQLVTSSVLQNGEDAVAVYQFPDGAGTFPADYAAVGNTGVIDALIYESGSDADATELWALDAGAAPSPVVDEGAQSEQRAGVTIQRCGANIALRDSAQFRLETPTPGAPNMPCGPPPVLAPCTIPMQVCPDSDPGVCGAVFRANDPGAAQCHTIGVFACYGVGTSYHLSKPTLRADIFLSGELNSVSTFFAHYQGSNARMDFYDIDGNLVDSFDSVTDCGVATPPANFSATLASPVRHIVVTTTDADVWIDTFMVNPAP